MEPALLNFTFCKLTDFFLWLIEMTEECWSNEGNFPTWDRRYLKNTITLVLRSFLRSQRVGTADQTMGEGVSTGRSCYLWGHRQGIPAASTKLTHQLCRLNRLSVLGKWDCWESPKTPSLASVPPECPPLSSEQDISSCCLSWLCPAPWFQLLVSILQCVGSFPFSEYYCFSDLNSHPENLSNRAFVSLFTFLIIYVFSLPNAWRHQIAVKVTAWGKSTSNNDKPLHFSGWKHAIVPRGLRKK